MPMEPIVEMSMLNVDSALKDSNLVAALSGKEGWPVPVIIIGCNSDALGFLRRSIRVNSCSLEESYQVLQGSSNIENRLGARCNDRNRRTSQFSQI